MKQTTPPLGLLLPKIPGRLRVLSLLTIAVGIWGLASPPFRSAEALAQVDLIIGGLGFLISLSSGIWRWICPEITQKSLRVWQAFGKSEIGFEEIQGYRMAPGRLSLFDRAGRERVRLNPNSLLREAEILSWIRSQWKPF